MDFGDDFIETKEFIKVAKVDIQSIILRYAPNFILKDILFSRSTTPVITLSF